MDTSHKWHAVIINLLRIVWFLVDHIRFTQVKELLASDLDSPRIMHRNRERDALLIQ